MDVASTPPAPTGHPPAGPPQLKLEFGGAGWVLLAAALLGAYLLVKLTWPLLTGQVKPMPLDQTPAELGFDLSTCLVPAQQIVAAAPPGSIPPLGMPATVPGSGAAALTKEFRRKYHHKFVVDGDRVVGVSINGESRAYQLKLLQWHEVANDVLGGVPIAVTYSPLTDSVAVYDRRVGSDVVALAASGLLYNSNSLLFEHAVGSTSDYKEQELAAPDAGERWYRSMGCKQCHSLDGSAGTGPTFLNLYGSTVKLSDDVVVAVDDGYVRESILDPGAKLVMGFTNEMPSFRGRLEDKSITNIIAFLKTLSDATPAEERAALLAANHQAVERHEAEYAAALSEIYRAMPAAWPTRSAGLWTQLDGRAITGWYASVGAALTLLPCELTHWGDWLARHPDTTLLSHDTGHDRKYTLNAYGAYYDRMKLRFPVEPAPPGEAPWQFTRMIAVQQPDGSWRSFDYPALADNPVQGDLRFVYEPFAPGLEPDSVRLAVNQGQPVIYGLRFAFEAFGYLEPEGGL